MLRNRARQAATIATLALVVLLPLATAAAAAIPTAAEHASPAADYRGWAYVKTDGAATAEVWRWAAEGWQAGTAPVGSYVWLYPWGGDWTWAWRENAWHAMRSASTTTWSCAAVTGDNIVFPKTARTEIPVLKFAAASSAVAGTAGLDDRVQLLCGNGFRDAAGAATVYALVRVTSYTWCVPFTDNCALAPPQKTTFTGYVDVTRIADDPIGPGTPGGLGIFPQ